MFQSNKPLIPVYYDNYQLIDNLMNLYGNKKLTLSELEVKQLLDHFHSPSFYTFTQNSTHTNINNHSKNINNNNNNHDNIHSNNNHTIIIK